MCACACATERQRQTERERARGGKEEGGSASLHDAAAPVHHGVRIQTDQRVSAGARTHRPPSHPAAGSHAAAERRSRYVNPSLSPSLASFFPCLWRRQALHFRTRAAPPPPYRRVHLHLPRVIRSISRVRGELKREDAGLFRGKLKVCVHGSAFVADTVPAAAAAAAAAAHPMGSRVLSRTGGWRG